MKIKDLAKATEALAKLEILDKDILQIEKVAELIVNSETETSFSFSMKTKDVSKEKQVNIKVTIDSDGSLSKDFFENPMERFNKIYGVPFGLWSPEKKKEEKFEKLNFNLSENESLGLLGLMIGIKQRERQTLLDELARYGVS